MKATKFEDVLAWRKARGLTRKIYFLFSEHKDYGFKNQIERAAVSIMNNIAEGFERRSNKELKHFLYIAKGSCGEVRSMLYLAKDLQKISQKDFDECYELSLEISRMLHGFIHSIDKPIRASQAFNLQLST